MDPSNERLGIWQYCHKIRRYLASDAGAVLAAFAYTSLSGIIASNFFLQGRCSFSCASISTDLFKDCQFMTKRRVCADMFLTESILISVLISAVARVDRFRCRSCPVAVLHKTQGPFSRAQSSAWISFGLQCFCDRRDLPMAPHKVADWVLIKRVVLRMIYLMTLSHAWPTQFAWLSARGRWIPTGKLCFLYSYERTHSIYLDKIAALGLCVIQAHVFGL